MSTKKVKILLIEDNPGDVRLIREMMSEAADVIHMIECTERLDEGLKRLLEGGIDTVLLDLGLPDSQGLNTFIKVYRRVPEIPIIVLTSLDDKKLGLNAVRRGAQDYLIKRSVDGNLLSRTVCYAIERKLAEEQIKATLKEKDLLLQAVHHRVKKICR